MRQVEEAAGAEQEAADERRRLAAAAVGEAPGDRAQQEPGDRVAADHHADREVAVAERPLTYFGSTGRTAPTAARPQKVSGEDPGEGPAEAPRGLRRSTEQRREVGDDSRRRVGGSSRSEPPPRPRRWSR